MTVDDNSENYVPLSRSPVWDLMRSYYEILGVEAWAPGRVPNYVTTNPFIGRAYANVIRGFLDDFGQGGRAQERQQPHYILELGAGPGCFSYGFLRHFFSPEEQAVARKRNVVYVMTDVCETNIAFWRRHPQLKPFVDQGVLDFAFFDVLKDDPIRLLVSKQQIKPGSLSNPLSVIANYVIDSLPHDFYAVRDNRLFERQVCHRIETDSDEIAEIIQSTRFDYREQPSAADIYENKDWNSILEKYRRMKGEWNFSLPVGGFQMIDRLAKLTTGPMFLLSGDFGVTDLLALSELPPRKVPTNGTFNLPVNYHAISQYVERKKGQFITSGHAKSSLELAGILMNKGRRKAKHLQHQFNSHIRTAGPDEFFMLKKIAEENFGNHSLAKILALLRLSYGDIKVFRGCAEALGKTLSMADAHQKQSVVEALKVVDEAYFRSDSALEPTVLILRLMLEAGTADDALEVIERNRQFLESTSEGLLLVAEILYRTGRVSEALDPLKYLLRREPGNREAQLLFERIAGEAEKRSRAK